MIVSTKGRYALRVMVRLAQTAPGEYIPLKEIAEAEHISQKYLEAIMATLSKANFVDAVHGKGGGYRLNRAPDSYTIGSILKLTEGSLAAVSCSATGPAACSRTRSARPESRSFLAASAKAPTPGRISFWAFRITSGSDVTTAWAPIRSREEQREKRFPTP